MSAKVVSPSGWFATVLLIAACSSIPQSVRVYAGELPSRADGQYVLLDDPIKKQLVLKDSELQCKIDLEDKKEEAASPACKCTKSASEDWTLDCKDWLGKHTPQPAGSASAAPPPAAPTLPPS